MTILEHLHNLSNIKKAMTDGLQEILGKYEHSVYDEIAEQRIRVQISNFISNFMSLQGRVADGNFFKSLKYDICDADTEWGTRKLMIVPMNKFTESLFDCSMFGNGIKWRM